MDVALAVGGFLGTLTGFIGLLVKQRLARKTHATSTTLRLPAPLEEGAAMLAKQALEKAERALRIIEEPRESLRAYAGKLEREVEERIDARIEARITAAIELHSQRLKAAPPPPPLSGVFVRPLDQSAIDRIDAWGFSLRRELSTGLSSSFASIHAAARAEAEEAFRRSSSNLEDRLEDAALLQQRTIGRLEGSGALTPVPESPREPIRRARR